MRKSKNMIINQLDIIVNYHIDLEFVLGYFNKMSTPKMI